MLGRGCCHPKAVLGLENPSSERLTVTAIRAAPPATPEWMALESEWGGFFYDHVSKSHTIASVTLIQRVTRSSPLPGRGIRLHLLKPHRRSLTGSVGIIETATSGKGSGRGENGYAYFIELHIHCLTLCCSKSLRGRRYSCFLTYYLLCH